MAIDIFSALLTLHAAVYNPNTETFFLEVIMGMCAAIAIGATIFVKEFVLRK
ncbi:hypothetical protein [Ferroplasma sp.]|uniref:hypothetical protein n=1 Tax=Ferroplasma sp. TaxID=2591003 RepID=UPI00307E42E7